MGYAVRIDMYDKRKKYMVGLLESEASKLSNQARFIIEKCDGTLKVENKKKKVMIEELVKRGYDSDPIKGWKKSQATEEAEEENADEDEEEAAVPVDKKGPDFDYLLGMPMWNLTQEKKDEICRKRDEKTKELKGLQATPKETLWENDLNEFLAKLDEVEAKELAEAAGEVANAPKSKEKGAKKSGGKKGGNKAETKPSANAIRIEPVISDDLKVKAVKAAAAKVRKANKGDKKIEKKVKNENDEFDGMVDEKNTSLTKKVTKSTPKGTPKKAKAKNPWSDSDADDVSGSELPDAMDEVKVAPREKAAGGRRAAANIKFNFDDDEEDEKSGESDGSDNMFDNTGIKEEGEKAKMEDESEPEPEPEPEKAVTNGATNGNAGGDNFDVSDSGEEFNGVSPPKAKPAPAKKPAEPKKAAPKKAPAKKAKADDSEDEEDIDNPKAKKAKAAPKKKATKGSDESGSDFEMEAGPPRDRAGGRAKKTISYAAADDGSEGDDDSDF